jgi:hypothetical protein
LADQASAEGTGALKNTHFAQGLPKPKKEFPSDYGRMNEKDGQDESHLYAAYLNTSLMGIPEVKAATSCTAAPEHPSDEKGKTGTKVCANCGNICGSLRCTLCKIRYYCSKDCQVSFLSITYILYIMACLEKRLEGTQSHLRGKSNRSHR